MSQEDEKFLTEVFAQLTDEATEDSKRRELVSQTFNKSPGQMFVVKCRCGQYCNVRFHCCENKMYSVTDLVIWINCAVWNALNFCKG